MSKTMIKVRFTVPGFHYWIDAPDEVAYLRQSHRHLFYFQCEVEVLHNDRDIEFHQFLELCHSFVDAQDFVWDSTNTSCEQLAETLLNELNEYFDDSRVLAVEVWEDNECGARIEYQPE